MPSVTGDAHCRSCTPGWLGEDCAVMETPLPPSTGVVCLASGNGKLTNFGGITFYVESVTSYFLMDTNGLDIWVGNNFHHMSCNYVVSLFAAEAKNLKCVCIVNMNGNN